MNGSTPPNCNPLAYRRKARVLGGDVVSRAIEQPCALDQHQNERHREIEIPERCAKEAGPCLTHCNLRGQHQSMSNPYDASASLLGYLYQCRAALLLALREGRRELDLKIYIERFDDVAFGAENDIYKRIQLKHSLATTKSLSDRSPDLWKTLRIWSEGVFTKDIELGSSALVLITSALAAPDSVAAGLGLADRQEQGVLTALDAIAHSGGSTENAAGYDAFLSLTYSQKRRLIEAIHVYTGQGDINAAKAALTEELIWIVNRKFASAFLERLEGWWINRVIDQLTGRTFDPIHRDELEARVLDIAGQFEAENLTIDYILASPLEGVNADADERIFVQQLRLIAISNPRIAAAILDYYRAVQQRSRWLSEDQLLFEELERYEERLVDEWRRKYNQMLEDAGSKSTVEADHAAAGRWLYNWFQDQADIPIRPRCHEPYVQRGTYHLLAGDENEGPRVGWHPEFLSRIRELISKAANE